jgi:LPS-assembly lipoprotein
MSSSEARRTALRALVGGVALASAVALPGCGFRLRGDVDYPFTSMYINAPATSPFALELKRALVGNNVNIVDDAKAAQVILDLPSVTDDKQVLSLSGGGRVREFALSKRVQFRLHDADGNDWLPAGELVVRRTFSFNESEVLAREAQEARLYREMQTDAVSQLVRRLQAATKPR